MFTTKIETGKGACALRFICKRSFAASPAIQPKRVSPSERPFLPTSAGLKFTRLPNGLFLVTVDNRNPVARISLVFKAGSRYETTETRGIVHRLRNLVGLSTNQRTAIDFNFHVARIGGLLTSTATRDHLSIDIQVPRDNADLAFQILNELAGEPFRVSNRELEFSTPQLWYEKSQLKDDLPAYAFEKLHKIVYRHQGLANSLLSPKYAIGKHKARDLGLFVQRYFVTGNATLVATGVDHEEALKFASKGFTLRKGSAIAAPTNTTFNAGETRKERPSDYAVVHIAGPAPGLTDVKGTFAYAVLANFLGTGPTTKWSEGGQSRLARAARKAISNPFFVTASNYNYEDTGLFSLFYTSQWEDSSAVAKSLVGAVRAVAGEGANDKELQAAKNRLKYRLLSSAETDDAVAEDLIAQASVRQSDLHQASDQVKLIDSVTAAEVQQAAKQLVGGKLAISSVGRLDKTPYLDELVG